MSSTLVVSHAADLDGVASAVLAARWLQVKNGAIPDVFFTHYDTALSLLQQEAQGRDEVWVCDLSWRPHQREALLEALGGVDPSQRWLVDHHVSSAEAMEGCRAAANIVFDASGSFCATDLVWQTVQADLRDSGLDEGTLALLRRLVSAAHSRDLWIHDDPMGNLLTDVLTAIGPEGLYADLMRMQTALTQEAFPEDWKRALEKARVDRDTSLQIARRTLIRHQVYPWDERMMACFTTGHTSDVADQILAEEGAGWLALLNIKANTISFRTRQETVSRTGLGAHDLAYKIDPRGGGHPCAAGCPLGERYLWMGSSLLIKEMITIAFQHQEGQKAQELQDRQETSRKTAEISG